MRSQRRKWDMDAELKVLGESFGEGLTKEIFTELILEEWIDIR